MKGQVVWITGLPGAGKTTIGRRLAVELRRAGHAVVLLDGDELRAALPGPHAYDVASRRALAESYARFCRLFSEQGLVVICTTVSYFQSVREWNRRNLARYHEVHVTVAADVIARRRGGLVQQYAELCNDPAYSAPESPDLRLSNEGPGDIDRAVAAIRKHMGADTRPPGAA